ncbi:MAG: hypothetical protein WED05_11225 [Candidatus Atabeyarchaeum deiterrae]
MPIDPFWYSVGIVLALLDGFLNNIGILFQKMAINKLPEGKKVTKGLVKNKTWLFGFFVNGYAPMIFSIPAGLLIGQALLPGLEATGLIWLALASVRFLKERLRASEVIGIFLMVAAAFALAYSGLGFEPSDYQYSIGSPLFMRIVVFTVVVALGSLACFLLRRAGGRRKAVLYALDSGLLTVLNNFYFFVILSIVAHILTGTFVLTELAMFVVSIAITPPCEILGIHRLQKAFEFGQASNMRPVQQAPIQIGAIFYFFWIYLLLPVSGLISVILAATAIILIMTSMVLLSKRQASLRVKE